MNKTNSTTPRRKTAKQQMLQKKKSELDLALERSFQKLEDMVGGREVLIDELAASGLPEVHKFLAELGKEENQALTLYEVLMKLKTSPDQFLAAITKGKKVKAHAEAFANLYDDLGAIVQKSIQVATDENHPDAHSERKMLMEMAGLFPQKGSPVQVNLNQKFQQAIGLPENFFEDVVGGASKLAKEDPFKPIDIEYEEVEE